MTPDDIRAYFAVHATVHIQIAGPDDGSPEVAWGDTFVYVSDENGTPSKMPFATIVTKDYPRFDTESKLDRIMPHPSYGAQAWASIINPTSDSKERVESLMKSALDRAQQRGEHQNLHAPRPQTKNQS